MKNIVLYHKNCADGSCAALAAYLSHGDDAEYVAMDYRDATPWDRDPDLIDGADVYLLDFSMSAEVLRDAAQYARTIYVIDHHETAARNLIGVELPDNVRILLDQRKSGAVLAWEFFHPALPVPPLLWYVQDRDLWRHSMPCSDEIHHGLRVYDPDGYSGWRTWAHMVRHRSQDDALTKLIADGEAVIADHRQRIRRYLESVPLIETARGARKAWPVERLEIPNTSVVARFRDRLTIPCALNCEPDIASDLGHAVLEADPELLFVALWHIDPADGSRVYSLRSTPERTNVAEIAERFGGGGHRCAAGFRVDL